MMLNNTGLENNAFSANWVGLAAAYVYVFAILALGEALRKWRGYPIEFTRKFVHVGVGMWVWGTVALFGGRLWAIVPPLTFVGLNYMSYRKSLFQAMETGERGNLGTVYFPISFAALILLLWPWPALLVAALMTMTWGDAAAAVIGSKWGQHRYEILGARRSWEGSEAMLLASWVTVSIALYALSDLSLGHILGYGAATAILATAVEGVTPFRLDNLTVPLISGLALYLLLA